MILERTTKTATTFDSKDRKIGETKYNGNYDPKSSIDYDPASGNIKKIQSFDNAGIIETTDWYDPTKKGKLIKSTSHGNKGEELVSETYYDPVTNEQLITNFYDLPSKRIKEIYEFDSEGRKKMETSLDRLTG